MAKVNFESRTHDLLTVILGALGAGLLLSTRWEVDTSGPYPFYKGPLIFPLLALSLMVLAALPAAWRLIKPGPGAGWPVDGQGWPLKPLVMIFILAGYLGGMKTVGLEISTFFFLSGCLYWLGHRTPARFLGIPLLYTAVIVIIFKYVLDVYFPTPLLAEMFQD